MWPALLRKLRCDLGNTTFFRMTSIRNRACLYWSPRPANEVATSRRPMEVFMPELRGAHFPVAIVGGGQAGLSASYHLGRRDIAHVVVEADRVGREWRDRRWDSFCLVTPNWQCRLPGFPYQGADPDGFMSRAEI